MPKLICTRPPERNLHQTSTQVLVDRHRRFDDAIGKGTLDYDFSTSEAKRMKLRVKTEVLRRAQAGDALAREYAQKRNWLGCTVSLPQLNLPVDACQQGVGRKAAV